jgi:hypothetical protein
MRGETENRPVAMLIDCGALGYLSIAAHGHADSLNFNLCSGDRPLFVDPGTYLYQCGGPWRDYFRSTRAHNTITVDKLDQSQPAGTYLWTTKAKSTLEFWATDEKIDVFIGSHDGYRRLRDPVRHRRGILYIKPGAFLIIDQIQAKSDHHYEQLFHVHPDMSTKQLSESTWLFEGRDVSCSLILWPVDGHRIESFTGSEDPILGWYSPSFGVKHPSTSVVNSFRHLGNTVLLSLINIGTEKITWFPSVSDGQISAQVNLHNKHLNVIISEDLISPLRATGGEDSISVVHLDHKPAFQISKCRGIVHLK